MSIIPKKKVARFVKEFRPAMQTNNLEKNALRKGIKFAESEMADIAVKFADYRHMCYLAHGDTGKFYDVFKVPSEQNLKTTKQIFYAWIIDRNK